MKVLIVESEFLHQDTYVGAAVERLADELVRQDVEVLKATSFDDGYAILSANEAIDCLMFSRSMDDSAEQVLAQQLLNKLHERQENVPVFLLSDREKATQELSREMMEQIDEFAWILEDTADFIAGRAVAAMKRYHQQLLPPLMSALMKYSDVHEYSWAAPGHQGALALPKRQLDVSIMIITAKICSVLIWGSSVPLWDLCSITPAHLVKVKRTPLAYLAPIIPILWS